MAVVLGAFVPDTAAQWRSVVKGEVARQLGVEAEAKKVEARLEKVGAAVRDAEARVASENDAAASRWLAAVRAAAYDADVAVDRCRAAARRLMRAREQQQQQQSQALPWLLSTCCDAGEPRRDIAADLKNVSQKLKAIIKEQRQLQLQPSSSVADHPRKILRRRKSEPTDINIVGTAMEDDARRLVRRVTQTDGGSGGVVAIVGPDGIGKTTLARVVFDSERVKRRFDTRSWVHVSNRCYGEAGEREAALLSQVIEAIDGGGAAAADTVADMEKTLAGLVANTRFLLVLDEVRNGGEWEELVRRLLEHGSRGSTVLVTAINGNIAREMAAGGYIHRVKPLGADDGWALLRVAACVPVDGEADDAAALKGIGRNIVDKCGGVPLAIKAVGGVLRTREAIAGEWAAVEESPAWTVKGLPDDAMKALYLCYDDMPCHLKQCFLYCSLFLSDSFAVDRRTLMQQWIAEGFVQIRGDAGVEEVADGYYDELIGRNLLQPAEADRHGCVDRCTMHDALRSMARVLSHGENLTGDAPWLRNDGDGDATFVPRHVSFPRNNLSSIPDEVLKLEGVRTLLLQRNPLTIESNVFTRLLHLKVLDLTESAIEVIPETLGNLLYLRFLNLSGTRIKALPETVGNLWSLKFLLLRECKALHVLSKGMEHLKGLRDLDLTGTVIKDVAFRVGHLRNLTSLRCFAVVSKARTAKDRTPAHATQDKSGWTLDELKNLCQLRALHVKKLENATNQSEAAEVALHAKTGLRELELSCSITMKSFQILTPARNIEDIFRELKPPRCLELLKIENYFGTKFPTWLSSTYLPNLLRLNITGCNFCQSFPPLGRLPELRSLCIADSLSLKDIDAQFMDTDHSHQVPFPKLEDLHLKGLHNLETWTSIEAGALPSLQALQLESCSKLRCLPDGFRHVTSMTELRIVDMESLEAVENIAALRELSVWNTPNLKKICNLPSLEDLDICHCPLLETVENINRLQEVHIFDHELQEMPRWIEVYASKLRSLEFMSTTELLKRCLVDGPDWSMIKHIRQVHGYSNDSSYIYYSKSPYIFESNASIQESLDTEGTLANSDKVDGASMESRNIDQEDSMVSSSGTSTVEIIGFFDTKLVQTGTARSEDNAPDTNMERFMTRPTSGRLPKLEEVPEEDEDEDEDEEGVDSVVPVPADATKSDTGKAGSQVKRDAPGDAKCSLGTSFIKSAGAIGHKLVREGSRAINITKTDRGLNLNPFQSKGHNGKVDASGSAIAKVKEGRHQSINNTNESKHIGRVHDTAEMPTISVEKSIPERTKPVAVKVSKSNENNSPDSLSCSRQKTSKKKKDVAIDADTLEAAYHPSNVITEGHPDKVNKITTSVTAIKNDVPVHKSGKEESKKSAGVIYNTLDHAVSQTIHATEIAQDFHSSLLSSGAQLPDANNSCISISDSGDQTESSNTSLSPNLTNEYSKATGGTKTTCVSGPCKLTATLTCKQQTADPSDDTDASIKKMASKISQKVGNTCSAVSSKHPSVETVKKNTRPSSLPSDCKSHAIDITAATKKLEATMTDRFSTKAAAKDGITDDRTPVFFNVKADDSHQPPKVYTAIWADTDTDTMKARLLSTMQHYRRMASQRRRRNKRHSSRTKWSIWPVLVAILLIVSVLQLLFTFWMYRKLLNQNLKVNNQ